MRQDEAAASELTLIAMAWTAKTSYGSASVMNHKSSSAAFSASILPPVIAGIFAIAVFVVDTVTPLDIAVAVLYVVVVLMAGNYFQLRGVLLVSMGCLALTVLSFLLTHGFTADGCSCQMSHECCCNRSDHVTRFEKSIGQHGVA